MRGCGVNRSMKLIIFDLDGTLLNTIADLGAACNEALAHFGYPTYALEDYPRLVGNGVNKLIERALPEAERTEANVQKMRTIFIPYYNEHNRVHTAPYAGVTEMLGVLREKGVRLAVASNKYQAATQTIVEHYFPRVFEVVLGERAGIPRKPHPQIVEDILQATGIHDKSEVLYVGDSDVDMQTAHAAGLTSVACSWGFCSRETLVEQQPTYLIDTPQEILNIL